MPSQTHYQNPDSFPLGAPTIDGPEITIDQMLAQPKRVTQYISDISRERFVADYFFTSAGGVTGGAVIFDQAIENQLYLNRDIQIVPPGGAFPLVTSERVAPQIAPVEKWGGKFFYTDEARERNDPAAFRNKINQLANTIVRKNNQRAIEKIDASIATTSQTFVGHNWDTYNPNGNSPTIPSQTPWADVAAAQVIADNQELGVEFNTLIVNPLQGAALKNAKVTAADMGLGAIVTSQRVAAGTAYLTEAGAVGSLAVEKPLQTVTWYDEDHERTWVKSSVRNVMYVTNPYSVLKLTGLAG